MLLNPWGLGGGGGGLCGPVQRKVKDLCIDVEKNPETKATLDLGMKKKHIAHAEGRGLLCRRCRCCWHGIRT